MKPSGGFNPSRLGGSSRPAPVIPAILSEPPAATLSAEAHPSRRTHRSARGARPIGSRGRLDSRRRAGAGKLVRLASRGPASLLRTPIPWRRAFAVVLAIVLLSTAANQVLARSSPIAVAGEVAGPSPVLDKPRGAPRAEPTRLPAASRPATRVPATAVSALHAYESVGAATRPSDALVRRPEEDQPDAEEELAIPSSSDAPRVTAPTAGSQSPGAPPQGTVLQALREALPFLPEITLDGSAADLEPTPEVHPIVESGAHEASPPPATAPPVEAPVPAAADHGRIAKKRSSGVRPHARRHWPSRFNASSSTDTSMTTTSSTTDTSATGTTSTSSTSVTTTHT